MARSALARRPLERSAESIVDGDDDGERSKPVRAIE
jgi:hypothetical protein